MATLALKNVIKKYGEIEVIHDVCVDVADGEFTVLVGPSGCGKSTLLRMIAGLESVQDGEIKIDGRVVNDVLPKDRDIAMVFQNYALYPHMTVAENMAFSLRLKKSPKEDIARKVNEAASILGLSDLLDRLPRNLSGGQRQRVAMGRAIVRAPQIFLFDEPLSNLDAKLRVQMRGEIRELHRKLQTTIIYVTHDQVEAMTMADRIVVMNAGNVEQVGSPLDLYDRPENLFVAGFIGSPAMNTLQAEVTGGRIMASDKTALPFTGKLPDDGPVVYGIRPEHFELSDVGLPLEVAMLETTGSETQIYGKIAGQDIAAVFRERFSLKPGDIINCTPIQEKIHLFDAVTGSRLP